MVSAQSDCESSSESPEFHVADFCLDIGCISGNRSPMLVVVELVGALDFRVTRNLLPPMFWPSCACGHISRIQPKASL